MKKGFTLVEIIAVVAILGIIAVLVVPKVSTTILNSKERVCDSIEKSIIDAANSYNYMHSSEVDSSITSNGYFDVTILSLKSEGLLETKLVSPNTNLEISSNNVVRITKNGNVYTYTYMGDDC